MKEADELRPRITINPVRRDGKHPVTLFYHGAPNMFGGRDFPRVYNKLLTAEQIRDYSPKIYDIVNQSRGTYAANLDAVQDDGRGDHGPEE